jgi:REP-associated tyrosine transposase
MCDANAFGTTGTARHVVHRRNDGTACFFNDDDYLVYLDCLQDAAERHHCAIHCYVLMPDRAQLLVGPEAENRLPVMMRCAGGRYAEYMHYIYQHHGAFWEHGTRFSMIGGERDLLACHRTIESAPVLAGLAAGPAEYRWSSYRHHAHGSEDAVVRDHTCYLKLGATQGGRQGAYRELFRQLPPERRTGGDPLQARLSRLVGRDGGMPGAAALAPTAA